MESSALNLLSESWREGWSRSIRESPGIKQRKRSGTTMLVACRCALERRACGRRFRKSRSAPIATVFSQHKKFYLRQFVVPIATNSCYRNSLDGTNGCAFGRAALLGLGFHYGDILIGDCWLSSLHRFTFGSHTGLGRVWCPPSYAVFGGQHRLNL